MWDKLKQQTWVKPFLAQITAVASGFGITMWVEKCQTYAEDRLHERSYLEKIYKDLENDSLRATATLRQLDTVTWRCANLLAPKSEKNIRDSLLVYLDAANFSGEFDLTDATFEEMKSSGKLALIHDDSVLNNIAVYYNLATKEIARANDSDRKFYSEKLEPFLMERLPVAPNGYEALPKKQLQNVARLLTESGSMRTLMQANLGRKSAKMAAYRRVLVLARQRASMGVLDREMKLGFK